MHGVTEIPKDEAIVVITRTFDAPRETVWMCMTDPKHLKEWWGGPGFTNPVVEIDLRVGGLWHHVMRPPNGKEFSFDYVYTEIKKPERISWQNVDHGKRTDGPPTSTITVTLTEKDGKTTSRMVATFTSIAQRDFATQMGFSNMIEMANNRLDVYLTKI